MSFIEELYSRKDNEFEIGVQLLLLCCEIVVRVFLSWLLSEGDCAAAAVVAGGADDDADTAASGDWMVLLD